MSEVENKKQTSETPERPKNNFVYYKNQRRPRMTFTPRLNEVTNLLQNSFPKLFTRKPEPKYALKIGIRQDLLSWAAENNVTEEELGRVLACWCHGWRYIQALKTEKRYDLNFNETPFNASTPKKNKKKKVNESPAISINSETTTAIPVSDKISKRKKITYPENWAEVYSRWKNKEISFKIAMELLGLKQSTFYKLAKEYATKEECKMAIGIMLYNILGGGV